MRKISNSDLRTAALVAGAAMVSLSAARLDAQQPRHPAFTPAVKAFIQIDTSVVALTHVRVIDGTGAAARADQTVIVRDGRIAAISPAAGAQIPSGAQVLDLTGKSVIPGLVMVHEHLYYPTGPGVYA
ncbi:MAG TPA: amidohydrolase, partial [Casimicrobiaceae bacterium]